MDREIANPSPVPPGLVENSGSKICSRLASSIPTPASTPEIATPPDSWRRHRTPRTRRASSTVAMASMAFEMRFKSTC